MERYETLSMEALEQEYQSVVAALSAWRDRGVKLNMARGKPSAAQLDTVSGLLTVLNSAEQCKVDGMDARNYGELAGLPCARKLWAELLGCRPEETFVGGNASLTLMHTVISIAYCNGLLNSEKPWCKLDQIKFLCPAPGYDRHFAITKSFGVEMITIPMTDEGPDMDMVEELVKDPTVKGIWCVPKYSNPDGIVYSETVIRRLASMKPAAPDFLIMWDNAYCIHEFDGPFVEFPDIISLCREAGNPNMVVEFASTSKITFPGAGISVLATSVEQLAHLMKYLGVQMISADKLNQLRHVLYLKDKATTLEVARRHGDILRPKFRMVLDIMERELAPRGLGTWRKPTGGYFVSYYGPDGTAKRALELCAQTGVVMTGAGATYPYGKDPHDSNVRIAPSLPPVEELEQAMEIFCLCVRQAALEKLMK
ncbi:MAG: aminotransferase class I/II-fold pyridoxal phosphate-dependent enzyme [Ruminococcaceae bacterium]|nr:aminotransferase class I/II-fold pyridoxal phosphate-dependent enzyme [Oscillospiraceae bacterium]